MSLSYSDQKLLKEICTVNLSNFVPLFNVGGARAPSALRFRVLATGNADLVHKVSFLNWPLNVR